MAPVGQRSRGLKADDRAAAVPEEPEWPVKKRQERLGDVKQRTW